jgi:hypothetical protein
MHRPAPVVPLGMHVHVAFPPVHASAHPPQLLRFVVSSTQTPLQRLRPAPHTQWPLWHEEPVGHVIPQVPQLLLSSVRLTHALPHTASPLGHVQ